MTSPAGGDSGGGASDATVGSVHTARPIGSQEGMRPNGQPRGTQQPQVTVGRKAWQRLHEPRRRERNGKTKDGE